MRISIHAPHEGERQADLAHDARRKCISIHAPHEGERRTCWKGAMADPYFNPRSPRGGATGGAAIPPQTEGISIHAPHEGERPTPAARISIILPFQSTLPTRGSDACGLWVTPRGTGFQSTLPTRGSDYIPFRRRRIYMTFQSTLPTRGSDAGRKAGSPVGINFNPRSPRGGATFDAFAARNAARNFNPRSPRGGATQVVLDMAAQSKFQSTLPTRGSDKPRGVMMVLYAISIHAPHEGERRFFYFSILSNSRFQSTLPTRGSDLKKSHSPSTQSYFNPRSPRGGATLYVGACLCHWTISIHAPHEGERQYISPEPCASPSISIHAPHEGERRYLI